MRGNARPLCAHDLLWLQPWLPISQVVRTLNAHKDNEEKLKACVIPRAL